MRPDRVALAALADRLEGLAKKATPEPWIATNRLNSLGEPMKSGRWVVRRKGEPKHEDTFIAEMPFAAVRDEDQHAANAPLIAELRNELPAILAALRAHAAEGGSNG